MSKTLLIIGRGHSGSRAITKFLIDNGFFMGKEMNGTLDKKPFDMLTNLAQKAMKGKTVRKESIDNYLSDVLKSQRPLRGAKNASMAFIYKFLVEYYPDFYYLYWTRSISQKNEHNKGDAGDRLLQKWGRSIKCPDDSWKIYYDLIKEVPRPKNFLHLRFEDFILNQDESAKRLEQWLGIKLPERIEVNKTKVHENDHKNVKDYNIKPMRDLGYIK